MERHHPVLTSVFDSPNPHPTPPPLPSSLHLTDGNVKHIRKAHIMCLVFVYDVCTPQTKLHHTLLWCVCDVSYCEY